MGLGRFFGARVMIVLYGGSKKWRICGGCAINGGCNTAKRPMQHVELLSGQTRVDIQFKTANKNSGYKRSTVLGLYPDESSQVTW